MKRKKVDIQKDTRFYPLTTWNYKDDYFQGGLVKGSPHKVNTIYLRTAEGMYLHLTESEAIAVIGCLSEPLWQVKFIKPKRGWYNLKILEKLFSRKSEVKNGKKKD